MRSLAMFVALSLSGCNCGPQIKSARPDLSVVPLAVDFGARAAGSTTDLPVTLTNTGSAVLTLTRASIEGDARRAFTFPALPESLGVGESVSLTVRYRAPLVVGADGATLLIESNAASAAELRVSILGRSLTGLEVDAGPSDGGTPDGGTPDGGTDAGAPDAGPPFDPDAGPDDAGCFPRIPSGTRAVTYQLDVAHTGAQPADQLRLPLCRRWQRDLGGEAGYPVVADGRVFVVTKNAGGMGNLLWALDQFTGATRWGPIDLGGTYWWAALAWENGRLFAVTGGGFLRAFDASTGNVLWARQLPGQYSCDSAPTAFNDLVFTGAAGSGGTLYALNAGDGGLRWSRPVVNGDTSSPAVSAAGVYVSYACNQAFAFNPTTGMPLWRHNPGCSGGGGKNVALHLNRVYTRDFGGNLILDATSGSVLGQYSSRTIPAFSGGVAFTTPGSSVSALQLSNSSLTWTFDAGGEAILTAPIVVGPHVIVASGQHLFAVNASDGTPASSFAVSGVRGPDEQNVSAPLAGFAAADGMLFVPVGNGVEAY